MDDRRALHNAEGRRPDGRPNGPWSRDEVDRRGHALSHHPLAHERSHRPDVLGRQWWRIAKVLPWLPERLCSIDRLAHGVAHHTDAGRHAEPRLRRDARGHRPLHALPSWARAEAGALRSQAAAGWLQLQRRPGVPLQQPLRRRSLDLWRHEDKGGRERLRCCDEWDLQRTAADRQRGGVFPRGADHRDQCHQVHQQDCSRSEAAPGLLRGPRGQRVCNHLLQQRRQGAVHQRHEATGYFHYFARWRQV
mmetsp:Transcript_88120/g.197034  ORF Transcript_88120/g.197034 Transcript_88120/m.197034 type:complete len:249 (+) Transcript_88120:382-1128(+)